MSGSSELADASRRCDYLGANQLFGDQGADVLDATDGIIAADSTASIADYDTADTLNGGAGDDTLIGVDGDTLIGGRGNYNFTVIRDFTRVQVAVQVVNFDVSEDVLTVSQNTSMDVIVFTFDTAQNSNRCRGRSGSFLHGLDAADIPNIPVAFTPSA